MSKVELFIRAISLVIVAIVLGACAVGPNFVPPTSPTADRYTTEPLPATTVNADGEFQQFKSSNALSSHWWKLFNSASLNAVVQQAIDHNPTLQASEASLRQSQDYLRAGYGVFYPHVGAQFDATRERTAPALQGSHASGSIFNVVTISGTISYALDVFGGERRAVESLQAQADAHHHIPRFFIFMK